MRKANASGIVYEHPVGVDQQFVLIGGSAEIGPTVLIVILNRF